MKLECCGNAGWELRGGGLASRLPGMTKRSAKERDWLGAEIFVRIAGIPRPLPRPRAVGGRVVSIVDQKAKAWRRAVETEIGNAVRRARMDCQWPSSAVRCAYSIEIEFVFLGNSRGSGKHGQNGGGKGGLRGGAKGPGRGGIAGANGEVWMVNTPDVDNLAKMVMDGAISADLMQDDAFIAELITRKRIIPAHGPDRSSFASVLCRVIGQDGLGNGLTNELANELANELGAESLELGADLGAGLGAADKKNAGANLSDGADGGCSGNPDGFPDWMTVDDFGR